MMQRTSEQPSSIRDSQLHCQQAMSCCWIMDRHRLTPTRVIASAIMGLFRKSTMCSIGCQSYTCWGVYLSMHLVVPYASTASALAFQKHAREKDKSNMTRKCALWLDVRLLFSLRTTSMQYFFAQKDCMNVYKFFSDMTNV